MCIPGMDAFMTGFSTLFLQLINGDSTKQAARIPLPGKGPPLVLKRARGVGQKESHILNWGKIASQREKAKLAK